MLFLVCFNNCLVDVQFHCLNYVSLFCYIGCLNDGFYGWLSIRWNDCWTDEAKCMMICDVFAKLRVSVVCLSV